MKKALSIILLLSLILSAASILTACKKDDTDGGNVIEYCECDEPKEAVKIENEVAATCTEDGSYVIITYCTDCNKEISSRTVTVPPTGEHVADTPIRINEETNGCYADYDEVVLCKYCDIEMSRTHFSELVQHTPGDPQKVDGEAATCDTDGYYYMSVSCTKCDHILDLQMHTITATGHSYEGGICTVCGGEDPTRDHYFDIYWTETDTFIFSLTENSNNQELPSTCARYIAGNREKGIPVDEMPDVIDDMVLERNLQAIDKTKVKPEYSYIPEDKEHGWGRNIENMVSDMSAYVPGITPDVYCNFVYDMVAASLSGAFANLKSSTMVTDGQVRKNWFQFTDPRYVDDGTGYMVQYMRSLSLSRTKQYCLASDYFTDMVRAFFVVPVNIQLFETFPLVDTEGAFNYDYVADGEYTIEDFYQFVYTGGWSYATLAEISQVYNFHSSDGKNATDDPNGDLDDRLIFALSESSALSASGMLYTSSVTIIEREMTTKVDGLGNMYSDYLYYYPASTDDIHMGEPGYVPASQSLFAFCDALTSLMSENKGIISITNDQAGVYHPGDALLAIRNRFVNNRILFGGVICLGSLEYTDYRDMEDGFGIVPVPLYRAVDEYGMPENYMTQIHNIGRIGAINAKTTKFAKISAYLDYQSMNSTEVLEEYYEVEFCGDVAGGGAHKDMLIYIRSNVRTSFDKVFDDAIGYLFVNESVGAGGNSDDAVFNSEQQKWHSLIMTAHFECDADQMSKYYLTYVEEKKGRLDSLEESYVGLPS